MKQDSASSGSSCTKRRALAAWSAGGASPARRCASGGVTLKRKALKGSRATADGQSLLQVRRSSPIQSEVEQWQDFLHRQRSLSAIGSPPMHKGLDLEDRIPSYEEAFRGLQPAGLTMALHSHDLRELRAARPEVETVKAHITLERPCLWVTDASAERSSYATVELLHGDGHQSTRRNEPSGVSGIPDLGL